MVSIHHRLCGQAAFQYEHMPAAREPILKRYARHLDGSVFAQHERLMVCESCGGALLGGNMLMPPPVKVYDMSSTESMQELYGTGGVDVCT